MKNSYYYLIASLPMLEFGMKPAFSHEEFLERCRSQLTARDMDIIENEIEAGSCVLREWNRFDRSLRNELARARAVRMQKDPQQCIKKEISLDPFISPFSHWAVSQESPLDAELYLDRVMWEKLEELEAGHYFDIENLVIYSLKLKILERWHRINSGTGMDILEDLLGMEQHR